MTTKGHGKEIAYALAHAGEILSVLEQIFGMEYPYDKLDILAVGDKGGAMENAGAVTFADGLLLFDEKTAPVWQKRAYASVVAHEFAHQWVGDPGHRRVVGRHLAERGLRDVDREQGGGHLGSQGGARLRTPRGVQNAIGTDALVSARAIRQPIEVDRNDASRTAFDFDHVRGGRGSSRCSSGGSGRTRSSGGSTSI